MFVRPIILLCAAALIGCTPQIRDIHHTEYVKVTIPKIDKPILDTSKCHTTEYVLIKNGGKEYVGLSLQDKKDQLDCDISKLTYSSKLDNIINYYQEVTK